MLRTISSIVLIFLVGGLMQGCGYKASKQISQTTEHLTHPSMLLYGLQQRVLDNFG